MVILQNCRTPDNGEYDNLSQSKPDFRIADFAYCFCLLHIGYLAIQDLALHLGLVVAPDRQVFATYFHLIAVYGFYPFQ